MGANHAVTIGLTATAVLVALFASQFAWWTAEFKNSESEGAAPTIQARPFYEGGVGGDFELIGTGQAWTAGALEFAALVALVSGLALQAAAAARNRRPVLGSWLVILAAPLLLAALLVAVFAWPGSGNFSEVEGDYSFWDSTDEMDFGAGLGWYIAGVAALVGIAAGVVGLATPGARPLGESPVAPRSAAAPSLVARPAARPPPQIPRRAP